VLTPQQWAERLLILRARGTARLDRENRAMPSNFQLVASGPESILGSRTV
jgi:hypothetical protein